MRSENCSIAPIKDVLAVWEENKTNLFNLFGKQLQITKTIDYTRSIEETIKEMYKINSMYSTWTFGRECHSGARFAEEWIRWLDNTFPVFDYRDSTLQHRYNGLRGLLNNAHDLALNTYQGTSFEVPMPNGKNYKVSKGCKVLRALSKIASAYNIPGFEDFRICHSLILNDTKIKGKLTLSIHPLDYWTMSDNTCDWSSCMSWYEYGAYRQGTVEMMNSKYVIVAYLSAEDPIEIGYDDLPWSNKKWRQLFIVDKDFLLGIKSYPYENKYLTQEVLNWVAELAKENMGWTYGEEFHYFQDYKIFDSNDEVIFSPVHFHTHRMYNDIGCCKKHWMLLNRSTLLEEGTSLNFCFSGESQCVLCGTIDESVMPSQEASLCCTNCDELRSCCCCESTIMDGDDYYIVDDEYYCYNCYCETFTCCNYCEEEVHQDDVTPIYIVTNQEGDKVTIYTSEIILCPDCLSFFKQNVPIYNNQYVYLDDIKDKYSELIPSFLRFNDLENLPDRFTVQETHYYWEQTNADLVDPIR